VVHGDNTEGESAQQRQARPGISSSPSHASP